MLETLLDGALVAVDKIGGPVLAAALTAAYMKRRGARGEVAEHDRRGAEVNENHRRWVRDRDREASLRMNEIAQQATAQGVALGGAIPQAAGKVYRQALHEYRDEATRKDRELDALRAAEGRAHARIRRRRDRPAPRLMLPDDCCAVLDAWRALAEDDPTRPELEPHLRGLERARLAA